MKIIINRIRVKELTTDGVLYIDGQRICDTAEATPKLLPEGTYALTIYKCTRSKRKIPLIELDSPQHYNGKPIPLKCERCSAFAYECDRIRISLYSKLQYAIDQGLPEQEITALEKALDAQTKKAMQEAINKSHDVANCPKILHGNGVFNQIDGNIIVGKYLQPGIVLNSRQVFDRLYDRIEKAISRGHQVELTIYNS